MSPAERALVIHRISEIDTHLEATRSSVDADNVREWIDLYKEREALATRIEASFISPFTIPAPANLSAESTLKRLDR